MTLRAVMNAARLASANAGRETMDDIWSWAERDAKRLRELYVPPQGEYGVAVVLENCAARGRELEARVAELEAAMRYVRPPLDVAERPDR